MPVDRGGCGFLRVRQPLNLLHKNTQHDTHIIDTKTDDMIEVSKAMAMADIAIVRQGGEAGMDLIKEKPEFSHLKWVLDIDDNIELISPYSEHYKEYGTQEFYDNYFEKWVWKDGENDFNLLENRNRVASLMVGLKTADMITTTTEKLAYYARKFNDNVVVLPNAVDVSQWRKLDTKPNDPLRIGWSGGISHYEDWYSIKGPLNALLNKYRFKLVVVGSNFEGIVDEGLRHLVETEPWVSFDAHPWHMSVMNLDIGIIPLADLPFNNFKSSIKFYEMAALGIPCVVSDILPYKKDIIPDQNALPFDSANDFYNALEKLILDAKLRKKIGEYAKTWVTEKHNAKKLVHVWENAYASLVE